jgi:hypothetical protein
VIRMRPLEGSRGRKGSPTQCDFKESNEAANIWDSSHCRIIMIIIEKLKSGAILCSLGTISVLAKYSTVLQ